MPDRDGVRLEVQLVGPVLTENVTIGLSTEMAAQLAHDLEHVAAGQGSAKPTAERRRSDLDARN